MMRSIVYFVGGAEQALLNLLSGLDRGRRRPIVFHLRPEGVPGVPRGLFFDAHDDGTILGETALTGIPLLYLLRRNNYRDLAWKGTRWLSGLAGRPQASPRSAWWNRLVERVLGGFATSFGAIVDTGMESSSQQVGGCDCWRAPVGL
jgi:hypothetical protein